MKFNNRSLALNYYTNLIIEYLSLDNVKIDSGRSVINVFVYDVKIDSLDTLLKEAGFDYLFIEKDLFIIDKDLHKYTIKF